MNKTCTAANVPVWEWKAGIWTKNGQAGRRQVTLYQVVCHLFGILDKELYVLDAIFSILDGVFGILDGVFKLLNPVLGILNAVFCILY